MLIVALVLAVIGLAALVTAVVTSNELIAWVCIGASVIGVLLLVVDAVRERSSSRNSGGSDDDGDVPVGGSGASAESPGAEDYPEQSAEEHSVGDDAPEPTPHEPSDAGETGKAGAAEAAKPD